MRVEARISDWELLEGLKEMGYLNGIGLLFFDSYGQCFYSAEE